MATTDTQSQQRWATPFAHTDRVRDTGTTVSGLALTRYDWLSSLIIFVVAAITLFIADVALLRLHPGIYRVDVGNYRDGFFLDNAHKQEVAPDGGTYRWTRENSTLRLTHVDVGQHTLLTLDLGGRPSSGTLGLTLNEQPWVDIEARVASRTYTLLLPPDASGELVVGMQSDTFSTEGDPRRLGVKFEGFVLTIASVPSSFPNVSLYLSQVIFLLAAQLTAIRLGWRRRGQIVVLGVLVLALAAILSSMLLLAYVYTARMAVAACGLAVLTWIGLPIAERRLAWMGGKREVRVLWALMLLCCWIRFAAVFYPTFGAQDLNRNLNRLMMTIRGDLVIIAWSGEFADGDTIYPPGPYLAVMPGLTATDDWSALLQGSLAFLDGTTAFLVAILTWRLGRHRIAARMSMLLYTSNIAVFGAMTYGFSAQIFGQWLTAPIALLLLMPNALYRPRIWGLAMVLLLVAVLSHIGVAILGITWVGLILALLVLSGRRDRALWWGIGLFTTSVVLAFGLLYIHIFETTVSHIGTIAGSDRPGGFTLHGNTPLLWKGMRLAYSLPGFVLIPAGLLLIGQISQNFERLVVPLAWVLTTVIFFTVDIATGLQVRYFYFSLPLAAVAIALVLGQLANRGQWGRPVAWAMVLALALPNILLWYSATMADGKISMTPLTH